MTGDGAGASISGEQPNSASNEIDVARGCGRCCTTGCRRMTAPGQSFCCLMCPESQGYQHVLHCDVASDAVAPSAAPRRALDPGLARLIRLSAPMNNDGTYDASDKDRAHAHRTFRGWKAEDEAAASAHAPPPAPTPSPTPALAPAPSAWWGHGPAPTLPTPALVTAFPPPTANMPLPESGDSSDVEVVSRPPRPVAELVDIADDDSDDGVADGDSDVWEEVIDGNGDSDVSGGSSDVHDEVVDTSDVEVVGGSGAEPLSVATVRQGYSKPAELRCSALAPTPLSPPPSPPLPTWLKYTSHTTGLSFYVNSTTRETVYAKPAELRDPTSEDDVVVVPAPALAPTPTPAPPPMPRGRLRWPSATPTPMPAPVPTPPAVSGTQARFVDGEHAIIRGSFDRRD